MRFSSSTENICKTNNLLFENAVIAHLNPKITFLKLNALNNSKLTFLLANNKGMKQI